MPNGAYVTNRYDALARLTSTELRNSVNSILDRYAYGYNSASQRTNVARTAGDYVNYRYDPIGQLTSALGQESGGTSRLHEQFGYGYDSAGNLNSRTNNALVEAFAVNNLNELTTAGQDGTLTVAGGTGGAATNLTINGFAAYRYGDASFALDGFAITNGLNSFTAVGVDAYGRTKTNSFGVDLPATTGYRYDLNGNLLSDGLRTYEYDDENELLSITVSNSWRSEFAYDGRLRRRIQQDYGLLGGAWSQTNEVHFIYDGNLIIQERNAANAPQTTLTRGMDLSGSLQKAGGIGGLLAMTDSSGGNNYYHSDGNGNVTCLIDQYQIVSAKYLYGPFGETLGMSATRALGNRFRFASKPIHEPSGMYDFRYRWYATELQRWLNRDPLGEAGGLNLYRLVDNSPIHNIDPDGRLVQYTGPAVTTATAEGGTAVAGGVTLGTIATVAGLVVAIPAAIGLVSYDLHLANQLDDLNAENDRANERIQELERELAKLVPAKRDPQRSGQYTCLARCNVHPTKYTNPETGKPCEAPPESSCPRGTEGWGTAKLEQVARQRAEDNAQQAIRGIFGCRTKHCHVVRCWKN